MSDAGSIRNLNQAIVDDRQRLKSNADGAFVEHMREGIVTARASSTGPYTVATLKADGTASATTFSPVRTFPPSESYAISDKVLLWFQARGELPKIIALGAASGGGSISAGSATIISGAIVQN
jgi:hypothetical protein